MPRAPKRTKRPAAKRPGVVRYPWTETGVSFGLDRLVNETPGINREPSPFWRNVHDPVKDAPKPRAVILEAAQGAVADREGKYGGPEAHFAHVARLWTAAFGWPVLAHEVPLALALLKMARELNAHQPDNLTDLAGYAALAAEVKRP